MVVIVNGIEIGKIVTNRSLTINEAMYCLGYDISSQEDCKAGYEAGIEGFYSDDEGYFFDIENAELTTSKLYEEREALETAIKLKDGEKIHVTAG